MDWVHSEVLGMNGDTRPNSVISAHATGTRLYGEQILSIGQMAMLKDGEADPRHIWSYMHVFEGTDFCMLACYFVYLNVQQNWKLDNAGS